MKTNQESWKQQRCDKKSESVGVQVELGAWIAE